MSIKRGNTTIAGCYNVQSLTFATEQEALDGIQTRKMMSPSTTKAVADNLKNTINGEIRQINEELGQIETTIPLLQPKEEKGQANGYCPLDANSKIDETYLPKIDSGMTKFAINSGTADLLNVPGSGMVEQQWVQPVLSSEGTMGGSSFAVYTNMPIYTGQQTYYLWKAFDGNNSTWFRTQNALNNDLILFFPNPTKLETLQFIMDGNEYFTAYTISGSNDNSSYTTIKTGTGSGTNQTINVNSTTPYQYYKFTPTSMYSNTYPNWTVYTCNITATEVISVSTADTLFFNVDNNNPLTYTNIMGNTRTVSSLLPIKVSTDYTNIDITGTPTITDGVLSNVTTSNYITLPQNFNPTTNTWEVQFKINLTDVSACALMSEHVNIFYGFDILIENGKVGLLVSDDGETDIPIMMLGGDITLQANTDYIIKASYDGSAYRVFINDVEDQIYISNKTLVNVPSNVICYIGIGRDGDGNLSAPINGTIDLTQSYIKIDGQMWWDGVKATADGEYKVALPNEGNQPYLFGGNVFIQETEPKDIANIATTDNAIYSSLGGYGTIDKAFDGDSTASSYVGIYNNGASVSGVSYIGQQNLTTKIKKIKFSQGGYNQYNTCVSSLKVQLSSDGTNWSDLQTVSVNSATGSVATTEFELNDYSLPSNSYKMRLLANSGVIGSNSYCWFVNEVEFYGEVPVSSGTIWLNPQEPYTCKQYDGTSWEDFEDIVLLDSSINVLNNVISTLTQPRYNSNHIIPKFNNNPQIVETYQNGTSWYRIYSDGWCEQGGCDKFGTYVSSNYTRYFLKQFKDTNYTILTTEQESLTDMDSRYTSVYQKYADRFVTYCKVGICWMACGYIK